MNHRKKYYWIYKTYGSVSGKVKIKKSFLSAITAQKMKFSIKDFFSKCDQIRRKLRIWSHLLKKSLIENFICCAVLFCSPTANFGPLSKEQPRSATMDFMVSRFLGGMRFKYLDIPLK